MADLRDEDTDAALSRGAEARVREPRAASARYDQATYRIVIELTNGCTFSFPPSLAQGLEHATKAQLADIEILGAGYGLPWPTLDTDLTVPGLVAGIFGSAAFMARRAGQTLSPARPPPHAPMALKAAGHEKASQAEHR